MLPHKTHNHMLELMVIQVSTKHKRITSTHSYQTPKVSAELYSIYEVSEWQQNLVRLHCFFSNKGSGPKRQQIVVSRLRIGSHSQGLRSTIEFPKWWLRAKGILQLCVRILTIQKFHREIWAQSNHLRTSASSYLHSSPRSMVEVRLFL